MRLEVAEEWRSLAGPERIALAQVTAEQWRRVALAAGRRGRRYHLPCAAPARRSGGRAMGSRAADGGGPLRRRDRPGDLEAFDAEKGEAR